MKIVARRFRARGHSLGNLLAAIVKRKCVELQLLVAVPGVTEELLEQLADQPGFDSVVIMFAIAPKADQTGHAQKRQVVADCRLRLIEQITKSRHMELAVLSESQEDLEARFISQELEYLSQTVDRPPRDLDAGSRLGKRLGPAGLGGGG